MSQKKGDGYDTSIVGVATVTVAASPVSATSGSAMPGSCLTTARCPVSRSLLSSPAKSRGIDDRVKLNTEIISVYIHRVGLQQPIVLRGSVHHVKVNSIS